MSYSVAISFFSKHNDDCHKHKGTTQAHCHTALSNGILGPMQIHVDKAGRVVLPKTIRQQLGITPDTALELIPGPDGVLLRRVADAPSMRQVDGLWVHQGAAQPNSDWNRIVHSVRDERDASAWTV